VDGALEEQSLPIQHPIYTEYDAGNGRFACQTVGTRHRQQYRYNDNSCNHARVAVGLLGSRDCTVNCPAGHVDQLRHTQQRLFGVPVFLSGVADRRGRIGHDAELQQAGLHGQQCRRAWRRRLRNEFDHAFVWRRCDAFLRNGLVDCAFLWSGLVDCAFLRRRRDALLWNKFIDDAFLRRWCYAFLWSEFNYAFLRRRFDHAVLQQRRERIGLVSK